MMRPSEVTVAQDEQGNRRIGIAPVLITTQLGGNSVSNHRVRISQGCCFKKKQDLERKIQVTRKECQGLSTSIYPVVEPSKAYLSHTYHTNTAKPGDTGIAILATFQVCIHHHNNIRYIDT
jgi:hypothetical protein